MNPSVNIRDDHLSQVLLSRRGGMVRIRRHKAGGSGQNRLSALHLQNKLFRHSFTTNNHVDLHCSRCDQGICPSLVIYLVCSSCWTPRSHSWCVLVNWQTPEILHHVAHFPYHIQAFRRRSRRTATLVKSTWVLARTEMVLASPMC